MYPKDATLKSKKMLHMIEQYLSQKCELITITFLFRSAFIFQIIAKSFTGANQHQISEIGASSHCT